MLTPCFLQPCSCFVGWPLQKLIPHRDSRRMGEAWPIRRACASGKLRQDAHRSLGLESVPCVRHPLFKKQDGLCFLLDLHWFSGEPPNRTCGFPFKPAPKKTDTPFKQPKKNTPREPENVPNNPLAFCFPMSRTAPPESRSGEPLAPRKLKKLGRPRPVAEEKKWHPGR